MIPLRSPFYEVKAVLYDTKAAIFRDVRPGEVVYFTTILKHRGSNSRGGAYAADVSMFNIHNSSWVTKSQSEMANIVYKLFVLEEIKDWEAYKAEQNRKMWASIGVIQEGESHNEET
ncbi:hypothetical protein IAQ67_28855 (plasmid) [Paenibacillus peoriae]|uniref:Uncharacterized protein n=1 Tax=Paenibacillus peoriae TaxID=59893 RepID=A0A7H0YH10_9BACL|nr:hypothetical protein [Paenibacillus peoriae]QNR70368.1 hypothetical protein IAQ67_28855 [Paenibacillus peoriae]